MLASQVQTQNRSSKVAGVRKSYHDCQADTFQGTKWRSALGEAWCSAIQSCHWTTVIGVVGWRASRLIPTILHS